MKHGTMASRSGKKCLDVPVGVAHTVSLAWKMQAISKAVQLRTSIWENEIKGAKKATGGNQRMLPMHKLGPHAGTMPEQRS